MLTSAKERVFCAGANIRMLSQSSHEWKVNFCKFTNETRNGIEDATAESRQVYLCAVNGPCAGGGYELALATDHIIMADDASTTVALPELPLLAVLPGTGGLTRLVDKRHVRRDRADFFCTLEEGIKGRRAVEWRLVDEVVPRSKLEEVTKRRAAELAARTDRPADARGIALTALERTIEGDRVRYRHLTCAIDRESRRGGDHRRRARQLRHQRMPAACTQQGAAFWPLALARELDDLILHLRTNEEEIGVWVLRTVGNADVVEGYDRAPPGSRGRLAGARDTPLSQARPQAARRVVAVGLRPDRARLVLRRDAARAGARGGSLVHAGRHPRGRHGAGRERASHRHELRRLSRW